MAALRMIRSSVSGFEFTNHAGPWIIQAVALGVLCAVRKCVKFSFIFLCSNVHFQMPVATAAATTVLATKASCR
jgi:hypothetical protein